MKRIIAIALVFAAVMVFTTARPVAASNRYYATGADVRMRLIDANSNCVGDFSYPANTPLYVGHGWIETPWISDSPANKKAFVGAATYFEFRVDNAPQKSTMFASYVPSLDWMGRLWVSEYDQGMTGSQTFEGRWYIDGQILGGTPGAAVLLLDCVSTVTFGP